MLDVIHLIVTVLSGQAIWFRPLKLTFPTCFRVVAHQCTFKVDAFVLSKGLAKGRWAVLVMVTEGGD